MHNFRYLLPLLLLGGLMLACKKEESSTEDSKLYEAVKDNNFVYYKGNNAILNAKGGSPHGDFKLRFNATAAAALGADGKLPAGASFPEGSIVLKEIWENNQLTLLVPMQKAASNPDAGEGWIWGEYKPNGAVVYEVSKKGSGCIGCHQSNPNRDLIRSFDLH